MEPSTTKTPNSIDNECTQPQATTAAAATVAVAATGSADSSELPVDSKLLNITKTETSEAQDIVRKVSESSTSESQQPFVSKSNTCRCQLISSDLCLMSSCLTPSDLLSSV